MKNPNRPLALPAFPALHAMRAMHGPQPARQLSLCAAAALLALLVLPATARADSRPWFSTPAPAAYGQECGSCHLAFPAGLLPARSWQRLMAGLDRHYGTDASVDAQTQKVIGSWLQAGAGRYKRVAEEPAEDRITRAAWFERKHRRIEPAVWTLASVKSAANCEACHTRADRGDFDDDRLKFPEGLDARQRRNWKD